MSEIAFTRVRKLSRRILRTARNPMEQLIDMGAMHALDSAADGRALPSKLPGLSIASSENPALAMEIRVATVTHTWERNPVIYAAHPRLVSAMTGVTTAAITSEALREVPVVPVLVVLPAPVPISIGDEAGELHGFYVYGHRKDGSLCPMADERRVGVGLTFFTAVNGTGVYDVLDTSVSTYRPRTMEQMIAATSAEVITSSGLVADEEQVADYLRTLLRVGLPLVLYVCTRDCDLRPLAATGPRNPARRSNSVYVLGEHDTLPTGDALRFQPALELAAPGRAARRTPADSPESADNTRTADELAEARQQNSILRQHKTSADNALAAANDEISRLRARLAAPADTESLKAQIMALQDRLDLYVPAFDDLETELADLHRRHGLLAARHHDLVGDADDMLDADADDDFASFADLLHAAHTTLPGLAVTANREDAAKLDHHPKAAAWRAKAWDALRTLNAYAAARHAAGPAAGPSHGDVHAFVRTSQPGTLISAQIIAMGESDTATTNERCRRARTFPVDPATAPTGRAYHGAHIILEKFRPPAPRIHFLDDIAQTGKVYIGYLGEHLPTMNTN